jgi:hypothetical protein
LELGYIFSIEFIWLKYRKWCPQDVARVLGAFGAAGYTEIGRKCEKPI